MQRDTLDNNSVLNAYGKVTEENYYKTPLNYSRNDIKHHKLSITERNCYYISNRRFGLYVTIADCTLTGYIAVILADFEKGTIKKHVITNFFPLGRNIMPVYPDNGDTIFNSKKCGATITSTLNRIYLKSDFIDFFSDENLYINLSIALPDCESFYSVQSHGGDKRKFSYNCFQPAMIAKGVIRCGRDEYIADGEKTYAFLSQERTNVSSLKGKHTLFVNHFLSDNSQFAAKINKNTEHDDFSCDNVVINNGYVDKLSKIETLKGLSNNKITYTFIEHEHPLQITFIPIEGPKGIMKASIYDRNVIFGRIEGDLVSKDSKSVSFDRLPAVMEILS